MQCQEHLTELIFAQILNFATVMPFQLLLPCRGDRLARVHIRHELGGRHLPERHQVSWTVF